ncbi:uncharacterized protein LOC132277694 [Cornus florida]|uniref:uncharacterized protein LOC132277694 n=1 Tax=Cornus florida TaxID=4283 RepID=UPI0028A123CB|nr:uncharacterized protein LOC132277694 [Cornus florida]
MVELLQRKRKSLGVRIEILWDRECTVAKQKHEACLEKHRATVIAKHALSKLIGEQLDVNKLYEEVMKTNSFDEAILATTFNYLVQHEMLARAFFAKNGSLMYAQVCIRLDISFVVRMLGRYQNNLGIDHWKAAKKVLRYLQGIKDYMLTFKRSGHLDVIGYSDSDFAERVDSRKFTFGYMFLLAVEAIS